MANVDPNTLYCWCPEYTLEQVPQSIFIVFEGVAEPITTDFLAPNIDEAEDFCEKMNRQLQVNPGTARQISNRYITETRNGAPIFLRPADFEPWDREKALAGLAETLPAFTGEVASVLTDPTQREQANAEMIADTAQIFDNLASQARDNAAVQADHLNNLKQNPEIWPNPDFQIYRAGEHLIYLSSNERHLTDLRDHIRSIYTDITGEPLTLTPDFTSAGPSLVSAGTDEAPRG